MKARDVHGQRALPTSHPNHRVAFPRKLDRFRRVCTPTTPSHPPHKPPLGAHGAPIRCRISVLLWSWRRKGSWKPPGLVAATRPPRSCSSASSPPAFSASWRAARAASACGGGASASARRTRWTASLTFGRATCAPSPHLLLRFLGRKLEHLCSFAGFPLSSSPRCSGADVCDVITGLTHSMWNCCMSSEQTLLHLNNRVRCHGV